MLTTAAPPVHETSPQPPVRSHKTQPSWPIYRALARKELRELAPWISLAGLTQVWLLCAVLRLPTPFIVQKNEVIPFVQDTLAWWIFCVAGILAAVIGLWQTAWESSQGTFQFLLHRPLPRREIFAIKLLVGVAVSLIACGLPIGVYALWAAMPGTHDSPFAWSMTGWAWVLWLEMPLIYLGAFLSGLRPARWYASRFMPLAAGLVLLSLCSLLFLALGWWAPLMLALLAEVGLVTAILYVAQSRDYS
jgi:hypothetical protein